MLEERLILILAYLFIAILLLSICLHTSFSKKTKLLTIIISTGFYVTTWKGYESILGWPTFEELPENFQINWAIIEEPNKRLKKEGSLYLWIVELDEFGKKFGKPRSYNLYWNEDNQKLVQSALHKLQEGEQLNGKKTTIGTKVSIYELLKKFKLNEKKVAIEHNGTIIPKASYKKKYLKIIEQKT